MSHTRDWDWVELSMPPEHGWFEPDWLSGRDAPGSFAVQAATYACVVMDLPDEPDALASALKRNVRESVRRSRNRLGRAANQVDVEILGESPASTRSAVGELFRLHRARADMAGRPAHENLIGSAAQEVFVQTVCQDLSRTGHGKVGLLKADGEAIAAVLLLRANGCVFFSASGMNPEWWDHGPMTLLQAECLRDAISAGDRSANLSIGPDVSKLRWSEKLELHNHFVIVGPRLRSQAAYAMYAPFRSAAVVAGHLGGQLRGGRSASPGTGSPV
jgi:CelD/BcsL family acetyltransferase involved in cellulose biosynthesis